jgi:hypothetical protein
MSVYTTEERIEAYLNRDLNSNEDVLVDELIVYISSFIDSFTNRSWLDVDNDDYASASEERLYDGNGKREIFIDDFSELEQVELLDSQGSVYVDLTDEDDWILSPLNNTTKQSIYLRNYRFPNGPGRIRITAVFNSGNLPDDVIMVATALASKFFERAASSGIYKRESIEGYTYELMTGKELDEDTSLFLNTLGKWKKVII